MAGIGPVEIILVALLTLPVYFGLRLSRRPDPRPAPPALAVAAWLLAAGTFVVPLCLAAALPLGGMLVGRGRRQGWGVMGLTVAAFVARGIVLISA